MTILNDKEIRSHCLKITHAIDEGGRFGHYLCKHGDRWYNPDGSAVQNFELSTIEDRLVEFEKDRESMISPFEPEQVRTRKFRGCKNNSAEPIISYGTTSMGYDVRLARDFKVFTNLDNALIDPLKMPETSYVDRLDQDFVIIPPNSYILGHTIETFDIPRNIMVICLGKSTYARAGMAVNVTPIEPGFKGSVVLELANQTPLPMKVYSEMGVCQFLFLKGNSCETSYADRGGKYQNQTGIQTAIV